MREGRNTESTNSVYEDIAVQEITIKENVQSKTTTTAKTATSSFLSDMTTALSAFRAFIAAPFTTVAKTLQGQLRSLSTTTDPTQSANLLSDIQSDFDTILQETGIDLNKLVATAASTVASGGSLSSVIPNFVIDATGKILRRAIPTKMAGADPVAETASTYTGNSEFTQAALDVAAAVSIATKVLPTVSSGLFKVATNAGRNVTQGYGGLAITNRTTTLEDAVEDGVRKNISPNGFSYRVETITETFTDASNIVLSKNPTAIFRVLGKTQKTETVGSRNKNSFVITPENGGFSYTGSEANYNKDTFSISDKIININQNFRQYDDTTSPIKVTYEYNETYDPGYARA